MNKRLRALATTLVVLGTAQAQAADFNFSGDIVNHNDVIQTGFTLATDATNVAVWTDSFQAGTNFDPITAVWIQSGTTWNLVGQNDDDSSIASGQTSYDSGLRFSSLSAGTYLFTVATYNNFAAGSTLDQGFRFDGQTSIPLSAWTQPANHGNMGSHWSLHLTGVDSASVPVVATVPEPETYAMLLAGLGLIGAIARRRRQTDTSQS